MTISAPATNRVRPAARSLLLLLLTAGLAALLAGCGGTKVYTADKTILYNGTLYNMGTVQRISSRIDGQLPDGTRIDMRSLDKKGIRGLLEEHSAIQVAAVVEMDRQEMIYQRGRVEKYSQYDRLADRFDDAMEDINDFMGDKKKTQLKLK